MYCKHCGKEIADDSVFCQYCGGELQEQEKKKPNGSLLNRFQSLSKGWQITIMAYAVWLLAGVCVLIGNSDYGRGFVEDVFITSRHCSCGASTSCFVYLVLFCSVEKTKS